MGLFSFLPLPLPDFWQLEHSILHRRSTEVLIRPQNPFPISP